MSPDVTLASPFRLTTQIAENDRASARALGNLKNVAEAREAAESFEAHFLSSFLESMFQGIETDGPFGGGQGETIFRSMLNEEYANSMSKSGGVNIADAVFKEILRIQEAAQ